ncbi:vanadium-dependent haloperoxidase [Flavisolibacter sp. BT320]|nr:vanadium-dependent haloperoxidase [Flavisolibacter longurius]
MKKSHYPLNAVFCILLFSLYACKKTDLLEKGGRPQPFENGFADNEMVMYWNDKVNTVLGVPMNQPTRSRLYAMMEIAVHDALNSIKPKYKRYALTDVREPFASPDAAVASAAYWVIIGLNRQGAFPVDTWYKESLAKVPDGQAEELGKALGKKAADAIIDNRTNDGFAQTILTSPTPPNGTNPGEYRSTVTAVNYVPTQTLFPFRILHNWGTVTKPYVIESNQQFRPPVGPYSVTSEEYTADFTEVKTKGARAGSTRTAEEEKIAHFWSENRPSILWNTLVRKAIENKKLDAWKTARLFALMHVSMAESINTQFNASYYYYYWRPETAVRLAATDGNNNTQGDPNWLPYLSETPTSVSPLVPGYPNGFAAYGGTTAEILRLFFDTDQTSIALTSSTTNPAVPDPKPTLHFSTYSEAARSNSLAMVYSGWDFRKSVLDGETMGRQIANYVFTHAFGEE